jgi:hypothetical protein
MKNECPATNLVYLKMPSGSEAWLSRWTLLPYAFYAHYQGLGTAGQGAFLKCEVPPGSLAGGEG